MEIMTQDKGRKVVSRLPHAIRRGTDKSGSQQRTVVARVVDLCGGCIPEVPHADLSKAAFTKLYDLDVGRVHGRESALHDNP